MCFGEQEAAATHAQRAQSPALQVHAPCSRCFPVLEVVWERAVQHVNTGDSLRAVYPAACAHLLPAGRLPGC